MIGKTAHDLSKLLKVLGKLGRPEQLHIVYEAGPRARRLLTEAAWNYRFKA